MAVVLPSEDDYFSSAPLKRSRSQPMLAGRSQMLRSASSTRIADSYSRFAPPSSDSTSSSTPSSPRTIQPVDSTDASFVSTPASNISASSPSECDDVLIDFDPDDHFVLPDYDHACYRDPLEDLEPPLSPNNGHSYTASPDNDDSRCTSRPPTPDVGDRAEDDIAVRPQATRHVDYLSHNWKEEEIWSSWRYIVAHRKDHVNAARLENASWRTWIKAKNNLQTVSPETLNWLKECDVTWLYGPLQPPKNDVASDPAATTQPQSTPFVNKKPILKKRSMSEIMLQRCLSSSSLLKEAAAAVQAQEKDANWRTARPVFGRAATDYVTYPLSSMKGSKDTSLYTSTEASGVSSPSPEKRRIHFNEQVEQCIAVEVKGEDDGDDTPIDAYGYSDSDDDGIVIKRSTRRRKRRPPIMRRKSRGSSANIIAKLPSTTLKDRDFSLEPDTAMKHSTGVRRSPVLSPSSSQETLRAETLRPSKASKKFSLGDDDDDEDDGEEEGEAFSTAAYGTLSPSLSTTYAEDLGTGLRRTTSSGSLTAEPIGMRRTESGMFMPCDEEAPPAANEGLFGRVLDTVNTARDIAHVIWNVGWRK